jgi:hypothetical protein
MKPFISIIILMMVIPGWAKTIIPLPDLKKPETITAKDEGLYITERESVLVYSMPDCKLKTKFGKGGEGPGEFKVIGLGIRVCVEPEYIMVNSIGKVSFFTKDGEYIKETNVSSGRDFHPFADGYVGMSDDTVSNKRYTVLNLYDSNFKKVKEIFRLPDIVQPGKKILLGATQLNFKVSKDYIFVFPYQDFVIDIYDRSGKLFKSIKQDYPMREITETEKEIWVKDLERIYQDDFSRLKHLVTFTKYWAAVRRLYLSGNKLYAMTFKKDGDKNEFYVFDTKGKLLEKTFIPLINMDERSPYPFAIHKGKVYQLNENEKDETWELHVTEI